MTETLRAAMLAAICDATAVPEAIYFNDDKVKHGQAVLDGLNGAGYTVVAIARSEPPAEDSCPCGHSDNEHVHYCSADVDRGTCSCNAEYARLAEPDDAEAEARFLQSIKP